MTNLTLRQVSAGVVAFVLIASLACIGEGTTALAQDGGAKREKLAITVVHVRPDMVTEFETFMQNVTNPMLKKGGLSYREVWQTAGFGDINEFVLITPVENFAQYDLPSPQEKVVGKAGYAAWRAKAGRMILDVHTTVIENRPELSYIGKMNGPMKYAVVTDVVIAPGHNAEFEAFVTNDFMPVIKQSGIPGYFVSQTVMGGNPNTYTTVALHDTFADIDKGHPVARVVGQDGYAKLMSKLQPGVLVSIERSFYRYRQDLSIEPATAPK